LVEDVFREQWGRVLRGHPERDAGVLDLALRAHEALRHRLLGDEKRPGDLATSEPAQRPQGERDLRIEAKRRMATGEDQLESLVADDCFVPRTRTRWADAGRAGDRRTTRADAAHRCPPRRPRRRRDDRAPLRPGPVVVGRPPDRRGQRGARTGPGARRAGARTWCRRRSPRCTSTIPGLGPARGPLRRARRPHGLDAERRFLEQRLAELESGTPIVGSVDSPLRDSPCD
jgi:hypothetical protein